MPARGTFALGGSGGGTATGLVAQRGFQLCLSTAPRARRERFDKAHAVIQNGRASTRRNGKPRDGIGVTLVRIELRFDSDVICLKRVAQFFGVLDGDDVVGSA